MSIAVLKRKTFTNNPREAPISGIAGGSTFGFSLNGSRRINGIGKETNLAPGAMTGPQQLIATSLSKPTGPGINGRSSSVCTNDPTVVKTTVMNTRGMLAKRLRGIERIPPMAPVRQFFDCNSNECGCGMGDIISPAPEYQQCNKKCDGPLTKNWVKNPTVPNGTQGLYIQRVVKINGNTNSEDACDETKSFRGIIGVLDSKGFDAINQLPQGRNTFGGLSKNEIESLVKSHSIMPFTTLCERRNRDIDINVRNCAQFKPLRGIESFQQRKTVNRAGNISKPGISTIDYGTYINRRLLINNYLPPQRLCDVPIPNPDVTTNCGTTKNN